MTPLAPQESYARRCAAFARQRDRYAAYWGRVADLRLVLFVAALATAGAGWWYGVPALLWAGAAALAAFVAAVFWHHRLGLRRQRYAELWAINDEGLRRLERDWARLPLRQPPDSRSADPMAVDLDLLGHASLQHLLSTPATPIGQATLEDWLLHPATPEQVRARQAAVAELAPQIDLRDDLALRGRLMGTTQHAYDEFLHWAEGKPWLLRQPALVWLSRLSPLLLLAGIAAQLLGLTALPLWLPFVLINIVLMATAARRADALIAQVAVGQATFPYYAELFHLLGAQPFHAPLLRRLQQELSAGGLRAEQQMARLGRVMALADLRLALFYPLLQFFFLWSMHVLWLLERWQAAAGPRARRWLAILGEVEALSALATLAHDNPGWTFPTVVEDAPPLLEAHGLGHPLLSPTVRVANDVTVGPPGSFLLVTGSNMSGKSTLLRAIGVNVVLAQAGGPVCAEALRLPALELATSMRLTDSLEQGVSFFMAELRRLKEVVDAAAQARTTGERVLLYLLDEILHGTNTAERQIAARRIIRHLVAQGAIGAVSTHDLTLADAPDLAQASRPIHFRETFTGNGEGSPALHFDYRLRPGLATSSNALKLMALVGLPVEDTQIDGQEHLAR